MATARRVTAFNLAREATDYIDKLAKKHRLSRSRALEILVLEEKRRASRRRAA